MAGVFVVVALMAVAGDRSPAGGGGWISLKGMITFLATFPVSELSEIAGMKRDFRRNADMAFAIFVCGLLMYRSAPDPVNLRE